MQVVYNYPCELKENMNYEKVENIPITNCDTNTIVNFIDFLNNLCLMYATVNIITSADIKNYLLDNASEQDICIQSNARFKDIDQFINLPLLEISQKLNENPFLSKLPSIIEKNWSNQEVYEFKEEDFMLNMFSNLKDDRKKFTLSLDILEKFVTNKSFNSKYFIFLCHIIELIQINHSFETQIIFEFENQIY